jgi:hypothetical protein
MKVDVEAPDAGLASSGAIYYALDGMKKKDLAYFKGDGAFELEVQKVELIAESEITWTEEKDGHQRAEYARSLRKTKILEKK